MRFDVSSGILTWQRCDDRGEFRVPLWARSAGEFMMNASDSWSLAVAEDLISSDEAPFLFVLVNRLVEAGFLEEASPALGGVSHVPNKCNEST